MNTRSHSTSSTQCLLLACALLITPAIRSYAQLAAPADQKTEEKPKEDSVLELAPFQVSAKGDSGYFKKNTMVGTRSSERISNIPQGIQIVTNEMLQDVPTDNTIEILKYGSSGINKRTNILGDMFMRGFRVRTFLKDNVSFAGNINMPLYDIDRIEVVKGPAAMIFGQSSATGGLINYVTKTPTEMRTSDVKLTVGTYNLLRVEANTAGHVPNSNIGYRGTIATTNADGYGKFDYNEDLFLGTTLTYKLSSASSLQFDYSFSQKDEIVSFKGVGADGRLVSVPADFTIFEPWVGGKSFYHFASLTLRTAITPSFQLQMVGNFNRGNNDWDRITPIGRPNATTGMLSRNFQELFFDERSVNQLTDFLKTFKTGSLDHKFSFGWAITSGQSGPNNVTTVRIADLNVFNPVYNTPKPNYNRRPGNIARSLTSSAYLQEQVSFLKGRVIAVGGYRYNKFHSTSLSEVTNVSTERNDQKAIKRYGVIVKPADWASLYYNYSESFVFNSGLVQGGPRDGQQMVPSVGVNKEIGFKVETSDGRFFASLAYFDLSLTNVRILVTLPLGSLDRFGNPIPGDLGILQEGKETNKGAYEADVGISLKNPLGSMQAILTLYHGDQKNATGLLPNSVVNDTWSIFAAQEFDKEVLKGLKIGGGAYHRGSAVGVGPAAGTLTAYTQPGYTTTTGFVSYSKGRYRAALNVDNIFDKQGMIEGGETDFWLYINPGRTIKFSLDYRF